MRFNFYTRLRHRIQLLSVYGGMRARAGHHSLAFPLSLVHPIKSDVLQPRRPHGTKYRMHANLGKAG